MDLSDRQELSWLAELMTDLRPAAPGPELLLVGAVARGLLLHYSDGLSIERATQDVDLAFAVSDWDEFNALHDALVGSGAFTAGRPAGHRLVHRGSVPMDIIPFGGIERPDGNIVWPNDESVMSVLGFRQAQATAIKVRLPQKQRVLSVSMPMLAVLKLLAWSERCTSAPRKDASDLFLIRANYLNQQNKERLFTEATHLLDADDFDFESAGAWLAGHDAAACIVDRNRDPYNAIESVERILSSEVDPDGPLRLVGETGTAADRSLNLLKGFLKGLKSH